MYLLPASVTGGSTLEGVPSGIPPEEATPEALLAALLDDSPSADYLSPFPKGLKLLGLQVEDGCASVDLSERYGGLSDISLTIADYSIVLTLCQLPEIESVRITAAGRPTAGRTPRVLRPQDLVLEGLPAAADPDLTTPPMEE